MKFSIVVATYNRKKALRRLIDSVLEQSHQDFELLIVDDGSTDGTENEIKKITDSRVRYKKLEKNHGTATPARNYGIDNMTGDVLIIWDSDDELLPHALQVVCETFINEPSVGSVCAATQWYRGEKLERFPEFESKLLTPRDWITGKKPVDAEIIAIKKEYIGDVRFEARGIDFMFYAKIIANNNMTSYYQNKVCGTVHLESDQLSLTLARRKRNPELSIVRASILDDFIHKYGYWFEENPQGRSRIAGHAFGAAIGYILAGNYKRARELISFALERRSESTWRIISHILYLPFGGVIMRALLKCTS